MLAMTPEEQQAIKRLQHFPEFRTFRKYLGKARDASVEQAVYQLDSVSAGKAQTLIELFKKTGE